ncbi:YhfZ family protein [Paracoccaceae bacterium GXU_MW_L88]
MQVLAGRLLNAKVGDRFERLSDMQREFRMGAGTIQTAIKHIEDAGGASFRRSGHQGSFIETLNTRQLWNMSGRAPLIGAFPSFSAPEMRDVRASLRLKFGNAGIPMITSEQAGSASRIRAVLDGDADFAVVSKGAERLISDDAASDLKTINFEDGSYYRPGSVVVLFRKSEKASTAERPRRIAVDPTSSDHYQMSIAEFGPIDRSERFECNYLEIPRQILSGTVDVAIWHQVDSLIPFDLVGLGFAPLRKPATLDLLLTYSRMMLVTRAEDRFIGRIAAENIRQE